MSSNSRSRWWLGNKDENVDWHDAAKVGVVEVAGVRRKVQLGLLADDLPETGDWVLIHVGFAMSKISEFDAAEQMRLLSMLGETEQAMDEVRGYGLEESVTRYDPDLPN
jgi:hydrogenase expression/formation protein HypC